MYVYYTMYFLWMISYLFSTSLISDVEKRKRFCSFVCFLTAFLMLAFRSQRMGSDLHYDKDFGYLGAFESIAKIPFMQVLKMKFYNYEKGFIIFTSLVGKICNNRQFFLAVCAFFSLAPISKTIQRKQNMPVFSHIILLGLPSFLITFSGLRQALAIAICFYSLKYIERKELKKFILIIIFACFFHYSAFIFFIAYPLYWFKVNKTVRALSILLILFIYAFKRPLFKLLSRLFIKSVVFVNTGAFTLFAVFMTIYILCSVIIHSNKDTREFESDNGLLNLFFAACFCQVFSSLYNTAMRVGYYFMPFICLLLPQVTQRINKKSAFILKTTIGLCFIIYALYSFRNSTWAMTYPYLFFWETI